MNLKYKIIENPVVLAEVVEFPGHENLETVIVKANDDRYFVISKEKLPGHTRVVEVVKEDGGIISVVLCVTEKKALIIMNTERNVENIIKTLIYEIPDAINNIKVIIERGL
jgi:hypothetical protein